MSEILFKMAAKTNVGLERQNNEDNFQVSANLDILPMQWVNNQQYSLGNRGALMVVADGMGGMNAGEVASQIAIDTVRASFTPEKITDEVVKSRFTIEKFMKDVIVAADQHIKDYAKAYPESRGMGTTIVIAWLFDGNLYVTWVGDSRAYIFNQNTGLFQISKDHSYVQELVDAGKITEEDAFDYPDSNIITRSLSDATPRVQPECLLSPQKLCNGDIILLCSDGLSGMIRDKEIEQIISQSQTDMTQCVDKLIQAALDAGGADNCTVAIGQIMAGGAQSEPSRLMTKKQTRDTTKVSTGVMPIKDKWIRWAILLLLLFVVACVCLILFFKPWEKEEKQIAGEVTEEKEIQKIEEKKDSLILTSFKAEMKKNNVCFTIIVINQGDSLSEDEYEIYITCNDVEQELDNLNLDKIPAGEKKVFVCSVKAPVEKGEYTYVATVKTERQVICQPLSTTIYIKENSLQEKTERWITQAEYNANKEDFSEEIISVEWKEGKTYQQLLEYIAKSNKINISFLKELNKEKGISDTAKYESSSTEGTLIYLKIVKRNPKLKK